MAIIQCSECGGNVSEKATTCPHCGCPLTPEIQEEVLQDIVKPDESNADYDKEEWLVASLDFTTYLMSTKEFKDIEPRIKINKIFAGLLALSSSALISFVVLIIISVLLEGVRIKGSASVYLGLSVLGVLYFLIRLIPTFYDFFKSLLIKRLKSDFLSLIEKHKSKIDSLYLEEYKENCVDFFDLTV